MKETDPIGLRECPKFSVVLPVYNEEANLEELHRRLTDVLRGLGSYELIFVDDGSTDRSWELIVELAKRDQRVRGLRFSRNFGHHVALTAGLDAARGEYVVTMDADLQDRPEEIPNLYEKLREGYDSVFGIRLEKRFSWFKRLSSSAFNALIRLIAPTPHPINTNVFRIMNRRFVDAFREYREKNRFVTGIFADIGFRQAGVPVTHGARFAGTTKYSLRKMLRLALNGVTGFSKMPLKIPFWLAIVSALAFVGAAIVTLFTDIFSRSEASLLLVFLGFSVLHFLSLGILAAYIERIHAQALERPLYIIQETTVTPEVKDGTDTSAV